MKPETSMKTADANRVGSTGGSAMDPQLERAIELGFRNIRSGSTSIGPEAIALAIAFNNGAAWVPGCCMGKNTCYAMERDHRNRFVLKDGFETVDEARTKMQPWDVLILPNDQSDSPANAG